MVFRLFALIVVGFAVAAVISSAMPLDVLADERRLEADGAGSEGSFSQGVADESPFGERPHGQHGDVLGGDAFTAIGLQDVGRGVDEESSYRIVFDANGEQGTMLDIWSSADGFELPECAFVGLRGKAFAGWNTEPDGKGCEVPDRQYIEGGLFSYDANGIRVDVDLADYIDDGQLTLYAMWAPAVMRAPTLKATPSFYDVSLSGTYVLEYAGNRNFVLDRKGGATANATNVQVYTKQSSASSRSGQQWVFTNLNDPGGVNRYKVAAVNATGQVLDIKGNIDTSGTNLQMYGWNGGDGQKFYVDINDNGTKSLITTPGNGTLSRVAIDITSGNTVANVKNGTNVQIWQLPDGDKRYKSGSTYYGSKNLAQQWYIMPATYSVRFNGNGSTSGSMANQSQRIDANNVLPANGYAKAGHHFAGWATSASGGVAYAEGASVKNLSTIYGATVNLFAKWEADTYTVSYNANGGVGAPGSQTKTYGVDLSLSAIVPTRASASSGSYSVTFDVDGGNCPTAGVSTPCTASYAFTGWNTAANGSSASYAAGGVYPVNASATLYAQWQTTVTARPITLPRPVKDGCVFGGWLVNGQGSPVNAESFTPQGNTTLKALWNPVLPAAGASGMDSAGASGLVGVLAFASAIGLLAAARSPLRLSRRKIPR